MVGAESASSGAADALLTAPLSKAGVAAHAPGFKGHTEFLAALDGSPHPTMIFATPRDEDVRAPDIALLSTHLPLASALAFVRADTVTASLERLSTDWAARFGRAPHIGLAALNPHAGEDGTIGGEESRVLRPAINAARERGVEVTGPYPADSVFLRTELDVVLALYHDQGTIMAKRAPWPTVNLTLGLSYVRTSPDHGTAYELAGTGRADHRPTLAAMRLAASLAEHRTTSGVA
jgi:4-hydroxythreonine-4-phosphate dehydrogenase